MEPFGLPLIPIVLAVVDIRARSNPRSIYSIGLFVCAAAYYLLWLSFVCKLPDLVLLLLIILLRGSLAASLASRFFEELIGKYRAGGRYGQNSVLHLVFAIAMSFWTLSLGFAIVTNDHAHCNRATLQVRRYFAGDMGVDWLMDEDEHTPKAGNRIISNHKATGINEGLKVRLNRSFLLKPTT